MTRHLVSGLLLGAMLAFGGPAGGAEDPGTIRLGAAVSLTGKYSSNGAFTRNGYDLAVKRINDEGGVTVAGRPYLLEIVYCDDESDAARGAASLSMVDPARMA